MWIFFPFCVSFVCFSLQQVMCGGLGVLFGIGFINFFTYFENDLDKVSTISVPLLCRWYEDDSIAFKVCTTVHLHFSVRKKALLRVQLLLFSLLLLGFAMASFHTVRLASFDGKCAAFKKFNQNTGYTPQGTRPNNSTLPSISYPSFILFNVGVFPWVFFTHGASLWDVVVYCLQKSWSRKRLLDAPIGHHLLLLQTWPFGLLQGFLVYVLFISFSS